MHRNKGSLQPCKKKGQLILKTPITEFKIQMQRKNYFYENVSDLTSFSQDLGLYFVRYVFFRTLFPVILFPEAFWQPSYILGKRVPGIKNSGLYFQ